MSSDCSFDIKGLIVFSPLDGIYTWMPNREVNSLARQIALEKLKNNYGEERPIFIEWDEEENEKLPTYVYIAWLSGYCYDKENDSDGEHLFIIGHSKTIAEVYSDAKNLGDKVFRDHSESFWF